MRAFFRTACCLLAVVSTAPQALALALDNIVWPRAWELAMTELQDGHRQGTFEQNLLNFDESRWFKFKVEPGSRVVATLTQLAENYDLVLFKDIAKAYRELTSVEDLPLLDAEFADDAFSPAQFSPAQFSPAQFSPAAFSPAQFSPAQFSPAQFSPAQFSPAQFSPAQFSPDAYAPAQFSPAQFSPAQFSPAQFSPAQFSPAQFSPAQFSEAAYASAQTRSVIGISAFEGLADEGLIGNTWNEDTEFYLRVRGRQGAFNLFQAFRLDVFFYPGLCSGLESSPVQADGITPLPPSSFAAPAAGYRTLILTDNDRLLAAHPGASRPELEASLAALAARPEVAGYVIDVSDDPWVSFMAAQAEANPSCPYAKNLLAEAIRAVIQRSRTGNALEYLVAVGNDAVIPFFRHPDEAMLGPEQDFVPPVFEFSPSQASLKGNYFLTQDPYGAQCEVTRKLSRLPLPDLATGRLVESPAEIINLIQAYLETPAGVLPPPTTALVTGYDFLTDAAEAVALELANGMGTVPDRLITPRGIAPSDPESWSADDLRARLLGTRHDILFLAGHFSAAGTLAADYVTSVLAEELLTSSVDLRNTLLYSAGCHSGYNIVDPDAVPQITLGPDWAQVCARKGMTLVAGTGYQYGDTDFLEYSERLYLGFTRQLRIGTGPVAIGQALLRAKREYLATTADVRGIHEKALLQATLFGLPMLSVNLGGIRLPPPAGGSVVGGTSGYSSLPPSPGEVLGLRFADISVTSALTQHTITLRNAEKDPLDPLDPAEVEATWFSGTDGVAVHPAEPVLPLEIRRVEVAGLPLRGAGFRAGSYADLPDVIALTSAATTEIRGVHPAFLSEAFYPSKFWRVNYFGGLCGPGDGGTRLEITPAQFRSYPGIDQGVLRSLTQTQFRLFYSGNIGTYMDFDTGVPSTPALSAAPSIANVSARSVGDTVEFKVQVTGNPAAGIQAVWVTYTATTGPLHGQWLSLDLTQNEADSREWLGVLPLGGTPPPQIRFMVQAVNGVGMVALAANLGAYFVPNETEPPTVPPTPTALELLSPPSGGIYGSRATFRARLTSDGNPLPGRVVVFRLGGLITRAITAADGIGEARLNLLLRPEDLYLRAEFAGTIDRGPSDDVRPFQVQRSPSSISLSPAPATAAPRAPSTVVATLTDGVDRPIIDQSVLYVVEGPLGTYITTRTSDFSGRAPLGPVDLPAGSYEVRAYFGQAVALPPPNPTLGSESSLYVASSATTRLTMDTSAPVAADDEIDGTPGRPLKIAIAGLFENDTNPAGDGLTLASFESTTGRGIPIARSGAWLVLPNVTTESASDAFGYTVTDSAGRSSSARVVIRTPADEALTPNLLGLTPEADGIRIRFAGIPGRTYQLQYSPSLNPPTWITLGTARVREDGTGEFVAPILSGVGFFRTAHP